MTTAELIDKTHKHGVAIGRKIAELTRLKAGLEALNRRRRRGQVPPVVPRQKFAMYDSIEIQTIPPNAVAVAGYVGGAWPTYLKLVAKFPHAKHLSIAVNSSEDAECLDIENGDASPAEATAWVRRQKQRGVSRPCLYASLSAMPAVKEAIYKGKIKRSEVRLWVAHYTYVPHLEPGFDACQWTDKALGRNLDQSLCESGFLP